MEMSSSELNGRIRYPFREIMNHGKEIGRMISRVWYLSQFAVLEPGDVINTGTPEGVALSGRFPYLRVGDFGDFVEVEIEGVGKARQACSRG